MSFTANGLWVFTTSTAPISRPALDEASLARTVAALGALVIDHGAVTSAEINPLRITVDGVIALEVVITVDAAVDGR